MNTTGIHRVNIDYTAPPAVVHVKSYVVQIIRRQMCAQIIPDDKPWRSTSPAPPCLRQKGARQSAGNLGIIRGTNIWGVRHRKSRELLISRRLVTVWVWAIIEQDEGECDSVYSCMYLFRPLSNYLWGPLWIVSQIICLRPQGQTHNKGWATCRPYMWVWLIIPHTSWYRLCNESVPWKMIVHMPLYIDIKIHLHVWIH